MHLINSTRTAYLSVCVPICTTQEQHLHHLTMTHLSCHPQGGGAILEHTGGCEGGNKGRTKGGSEQKKRDITVAVGSKEPRRNEKLFDGVLEISGWWHYLPGLVNLGTRRNKLTNDGHMTLLSSEEQRSGTILEHTEIIICPFFLMAIKKMIKNHTNCSITVLAQMFVCAVRLYLGTKTSPAKCHPCLTQQPAETWETGFHQPAYCVQLIDGLLTVRATGAWKRPNMWMKSRGLTFSWSWTLAPFFNRVSTTLECPYWEAAVRAVPPSCHKNTHRKDSGQQMRSFLIVNKLHAAKRKSVKSQLGSNTAWAAYSGKHFVSFLSLHESQPLLHNKRCNRRCYKSHCIAAAYLCLEFGGGTELKEELHDVIVTLLGGEEEGSRACLEGVIKIDTAVSYSERNNFLCLYDTQKRMGGKTN